MVNFPIPQHVGKTVVAPGGVLGRVHGRLTDTSEPFDRPVEEQQVREALDNLWTKIEPQIEAEGWPLDQVRFELTMHTSQHDFERNQVRIVLDALYCPPEQS